MNWDQIEGNWKQMKGKVQGQWAKLTDRDLERVQGKRTELMGKLQARYGMTREQAQREIDQWVKKLRS